MYSGLGLFDASTDVVPDVADDGRDGSAEQEPEPNGEYGEQAGERPELGNEQRQDEMTERALRTMAIA